MAPEGRLDTLHWLSPPLSISGFPLSSYLQLLSVALSPRQHFPSLLLSLSLSSISFSLPLPPLSTHYLPACAPLSQDCEQVTVVQRGGPPGLAMRGTDGLPCPFSKIVDIRGYFMQMHDVFQSPLSAVVDSEATEIMSDNACKMPKIHSCHCQSNSFIPPQLLVFFWTDFCRTWHLTWLF